MVSTGHRHVRNQGEPSAREVRLPHTGRQSSRVRRLHHELEGPEVVPVSTMESAQQGSGENEGGQMSGHSHRPQMAGTTMVPVSPRDAAAHADRAPARARPTATRRASSPGIGDAQAPRLELVLHGLRDQHFSRSVADRIAAAGRAESTINIYNSKWTLFTEWCSQHKLDPLQVTVHRLADFLLFLREDKGFMPSTIAGYVTAIADTITKATGATPPLSVHPAIVALLKSFKAEVLRDPTPKVPQWDLTLVLESLTRAPYEPIADCDLELITQKVFFLCCLAAGRRRGDMLAIQHNRLAWYKDGQVVHLQPYPGYVPKAPSCAEGQRRYNPVIISSLHPLIGHDREEAEYALCPVRALKWYLDRTKDRRSGACRLFLNHQEGRGSQPPHPNTASGWVRAVIKRAYAQASRKLDNPHSVRAHEVRALAASLAAHANYSMEQLMSNCCWATHNVFTTHYLRDLSGIQGGLHSLGTVAVAGALATL